MARGADREDFAGRGPLSRRDFVLAGLAVPLGLYGLAACGGSSGSSSSSSAAASSAADTGAAAASTAAATTAAAATSAADTASATTAAASTAAKQEDFSGVKLTVVTRGGLSDEDVWKDAKAAWEQRTGGKVEFQVIGDFANFDVKYAGYIASKDSSVDLLYSYVGFTGAYGANLYEDISSVIGDTSDFLPGVLKAATVDGKLLLVPVHSEMEFFQFNTALFTAAGIDPASPPKTWQEYFDLTSKLKTGDVAANVTPMVHAGTSFPYFMLFYNSTDSDLLSADLKSVNFKNDNGLKAFETMAAGMKSGFFDPKAITLPTEYDTGKIFNAGKAASQCSFAELWGQAVNPEMSKITDSVGFSVMPGIEAGQTGSFNGFEGFALNKFGKQKEAALSFALEMVDPAVQKAMTLSKVLPSSRASILQDPDVLKEYPIGSVLAEQGSHRVDRPSPPYYNDMSTVFDSVMARLWKGNITAQQAVDEAASGVQKAIDNFYNG